MTCSATPYDRVFLELGPISIYWYGIIIATGAFIGLYLATREADRLNLNKDYIVDLIVFAIPIAIIFARMYYVVFEWQARYANEPFWKVFAVWEGGIAIHGALIGSVLTAIVYTRIRKLSFWQIADILAPSLILGQAIGRWGNFMNQEAFGSQITAATYERFHQYLPDFIMNQMCVNGVYHHPTFLYESVWNLLVFGLLLYLRRVNPYRGEIFLSYVIAYSVGRFFIEGLRLDSLYIIEGLRTAQFLSIILIVSAIGIIIYRRRSKIVKHHYNGQRIKR